MKRRPLDPAALLEASAEARRRLPDTPIADDYLAETVERVVRAYLDAAPAETPK